MKTADNERQSQWNIVGRYDKFLYSLEYSH